MDRLPQEIDKDCVESLEAVLVFLIISEQHILLEKEDVVLAAFDKGQPVVQNVVRGRTSLLAKQRFSGPSQAVLLDILNRLKYVLAHVSEQVAAVRLQFGEARLDHVGLLGMIEMLAARPDPFLGFEQQVRELRSDLLREVLQQSDAKKQIDLDILFVLGLLQPGVQKFGKLPLPGGRLGRARGLPVGFAAQGLPAVRLRCGRFAKEK